MTQFELPITIWKWLPTFRVLAETEHLPSAAKRLHVTAPAISRTIRLLEQELGCKLFNRVGRSLVLNSTGVKLLEAVQGSMQNLEIGLSEVLSDPLSGPARICSSGILNEHFVMPALLDLSSKHPNMQPVLENSPIDEANPKVARGEILVAFSEKTDEFPGVQVEHLGRATVSLYCGRSHPLFTELDPTPEKILRHAFSVPTLKSNGTSGDGWPAEISRRVGLRVSLLTNNLEACVSGRFLAVLPDITAHTHLSRGQLRKIRCPWLSPIDIYASYRSTKAAGNNTKLIVEAVKTQIETGQRKMSSIYDEASGVLRASEVTVLAGTGSSA